MKFFIQPLTEEIIHNHLALEHDLEFCHLLPAKEYSPLHYQYEEARARAIVKNGGWGFVTAQAFVLVRPLSWDSQHFNFACADLFRFYCTPDASDEEKQELVHYTLEAAKKRGVIFLSARLSAKQNDLVQLLEEQGFRLVDTSVELGGHFPLPNHLVKEHKVHLRPAHEQDQQSLKAMAITFTDNRFYHDPHISIDQAKEVYASWVLSAMRGEHGRLAVIEHEGKMAGFSTYYPADSLLGIGMMGLVVIHPNFRGCHLLDHLIAGMKDYAGGQALATSTQVSNTQALRGFGRNGLLPYGARHIFHYWLNG